MTDARAQTGSELHVLAWPAFKTAHENPYQKLLYDRLEALGVTVEELSTRRLAKRQPPADLWHMHFPETLLKYKNRFTVLRKFVKLFWRLRIAHKRGTKIVWTVHNLNHDGASHALLEPLYWWLFLGRVDACIHLSETGWRVAQARRPAIAKLPGHVVAHMHYRGCYADSLTRDQARARLGLSADAKVALYIGQLRPYKNVPALIHAFRDIDDTAARLMIAGRKREPGVVRDINDAAAGDTRIALHLEFIPDDELQTYLRAADLTVLPFSDMLNSGAVMLALSFDCPVLAPDIGSLRAMAVNVGSQWVRLYRGRLSPELLGRELDGAAASPRDPPDLSHYDQTAIAQHTLSAYRQICRSPSV